MTGKEKAILEKIRKAEREIAYATPEKTARLTSKIVKWINGLFDR